MSHQDLLHTQNISPRFKAMQIAINFFLLISYQCILMLYYYLFSQDIVTFIVYQKTFHSS